MTNNIEDVIYKFYKQLKWELKKKLAKTPPEIAAIIIIWVVATLEKHYITATPFNMTHP